MAGRITAGTERALRRHTSGEAITAAARAEGVDPSTVFRALKRMRESGAEVPRQRIVIVGAGGLGRELAQSVRRDGREQITFLDDSAHGAHIGGTVESYERQLGDEVLLAVADPKVRKALADRIQAATFVCSSAMCGDDCQIGVGTLLLRHAFVSVGAVLGECVVVNVSGKVGHDVRLGSFCTLSSDVDLMGGVQVGAGVFFGSGARVLPGVTIGDDACIGAGAVVVKDVPARATMFGNPARQVA